MGYTLLSRRKEKNLNTDSAGSVLDHECCEEDEGQAEGGGGKGDG